MKRNRGWVLLGFGVPTLLFLSSVFVNMESRFGQVSQSLVPSSCSEVFSFGSQNFVLCPAEVFDETPTETQTETITPLPTDTDTPVPTSTDTQVPPSPTGTPGNIAPFVGAPVCVHPNNDTFHTLWNSSLGCHYDHEHGVNPFTSQVASAFPGFDLRALLGNVEIGHTNPSSPMENTHKHGGMKWQVDTAAPKGCAVGFESGTVAVDAYAIQFHDFGRQDLEFETSKHSTASLLRQCKSSNPSDKGYVYVTQLQEYGQRVVPYQGAILNYPDNFLPLYASPRGPYFTTECVGSGLPNCRPNIGFYSGALNRNNGTIWTSKPTGSGPRPETSKLFRLLFRGRDAYQSLDSSDLTHPFTWLFACGGSSYTPFFCRYNNSTSTIHEIAGDIPAAWDGLSGFDTDPRAGRITAEGYVTDFGDLNTACTAPGTGCHPIKLVSAFVGRYSSELSAAKVSNPNPTNTQERDIYFCDIGVLCSETSAGAIPSGWIGPDN